MREKIRVLGLTTKQFEILKYLYNKDDYVTIKEIGRGADVSDKTSAWTIVDSLRRKFLVAKNIHEYVITATGQRIFAEAEEIEEKRKQCH